jgi:hypothetical protein
VGLGEEEALVLGDLDEVDVVGGGDGEQAALPGDEEEVGHLSLLLQLQGQLNAGPSVHQHSPALPKNPVLCSVPDPDPCFWASRIRILLSSSKNSKKNLDSYCFVTSFGLFIFEKLCK